MRPSDATLVVAGDCRHEEIELLAGAAFDKWAGSAPGDPPSSAALPLPAPPEGVLRPGAPRSEIRIRHLAGARKTPDYHALVAANMVLGGQFVSRINLNLREEKGFPYGARTSFDFRRMAGPFALQVSVQTAATAQAIHESFDEIAAIRGPRPVSSDELALVVSPVARG